MGIGGAPRTSFSSHDLDSTTAIAQEYNRVDRTDHTVQRVCNAYNNFPNPKTYFFFYNENRLTLGDSRIRCLVL